MYFFFFLFSLISSLKNKNNGPNPYGERNSGKMTGLDGKNAYPPNTADCQAKNTFLLSTGECACVEGFKYGDPKTMQGCFNCHEECPEYSICSFPGECKCLPGYNDINFQSSKILCKPIPPELTSIQPDASIAKISKRIANISYVFMNDFAHTDVYCKFGSIIVKGKLDKQGHALCNIPPQKEGKIDFYLSFDNETWSIDPLEFTYIKGSFKYIKHIITTIAICCIITGFYLIHKEAAEEMDNESIDEDEPFSKIPKKDIPLEEAFET